MKRYQCNDYPSGFRILTEQEILDEYYGYWCDRMRKAGKEDEISKELCIEDWILVNYAWEV